MFRLEVNVVRHRRYIAYILVTVLCLGVIAPGLLGVFPNIAKADLPTGYNLYWDDFKSRCNGLTNDEYELGYLNVFFNYVELNWDESTFNVFVIEDTSGNFSAMMCKRTNGTGFYGSGWTNPAEYQLTFGTYPSYIKMQGYIRYYAASGTLMCRTTIDGSNDSTTARRSALDLSSSSINPATLYCTPFEWSQAGWKCYSLHGLSQGNTAGYSMPANILAGSDVPPVEEFNLLTFYMGQQLFITSSLQHLLSQMDPEKMDTVLTVGFTKIEGLEVVTQYFDFSYTSLIQIEYPGDVVNSINDTIPDFGIYAINISGIVSQGYDQIFDAMFVSFEDDIKYGQAVNVPINFKTEEEQETENNVNTWSTFNEYHNTYNTTHVIPQSLGDALFGLNGSQIYPCNVMVPLSVWNNSPDHDGGTSFGNIYTWLWWFPLIPNNLGFNYNLLDTIILSESSTGEYSVVYWYDDKLTNKFLKVKDQSFTDILQEFDCIIIIPDDDGCLRASTWWRDTLATICSRLGIDTSSLLNALAMCGSSSLGVEYVEERPEEMTHILQGYALLTPKAIQKQLLWNFNDGITKLYQLEVDYIDSEDKWKDSFLLWSSSVFYAIDSLGGKLDSLITKLGNIEGKLDRLIQNTSEEESSYWFISLWNWVVQFNPSDNDFANSLQQYDNNWNNMPSLPPPSPLPMLPGGE